MTTLPQPDSDLNVDLLREKRRFEREPLGAVPDSQRWAVRCMHVSCDWTVTGLLSEEAARTAGELHRDKEGHPSRLRAVIEFDCGVIR